MSPISVDGHDMADMTRDSWVWDTDHKSSHVVLSPNHEAAYFHVDPMLESTGTAGVRGTKGFMDGEHYWEIEFIEPPMGTSVMVGVGTKETLLHTENYQYVDLIGRDEHSWGLSYKGTAWHCGRSQQYCAPFYEPSTKLGVHLMLYGAGTLTFYQNGRCLGPAFEGLVGKGPLYPIISSTAVSTELEVGRRASRYLSLQEKCYHAVARSLKSAADVDKLPLPYTIRQHMQQLVTL